MKRNIFAILGYTALVAVVLLMSQCESRVTLTTPKMDAQRIIGQLTQPADHPINIYHPEGEYLKGLVVYVE